MSQDNWRDIYAQKQSAQNQKSEEAKGFSYSGFIRLARLILPVFAVMMIVAVFVLSGQDEMEMANISDVEEPSLSAKIGKNELLNPEFSSRDDEGRPYVITADRAFQGSGNDDLMILENPLADVQMDDGHYVVATSKQGGYRQDTGRLFLNDSVQVVHDEGLHLLSEELHVNLDQNLVWTDIDVEIQGVEGVLKAKGMNGNAALSVLRFTGPAELVLYDDKGPGLNGLSGGL